MGILRNWRASGPARDEPAPASADHRRNRRRTRFEHLDDGLDAFVVVRLGNRTRGNRQNIQADFLRADCFGPACLDRSGLA
jgi:hypothetical protein